MAKEIINIGTTPNDGTGDPLRTAFTKVNENFTELYDTADTQDLDFTGDSGTGAVELDSQTLNLVGTNGVQTTASGQTITIDTSSLDTRLTTAEADIDTNTASITTEASTRSSADTALQGQIDSNDTDIATNAANIATNTANISSNDTDITALQTDKYDKTGGTITGNATITGNLIVDTNTLYVDSTNNQVGIGTDSPQVELDIASTAPQVRLTDTDGGYCDVTNISGNLLLQADKGNTQPSSYMRFDVDATERMRITSGGDISFRDTSNNESFYWDASAASLGIGTDSPSVKLDVRGNSGYIANLETTSTSTQLRFTNITSQNRIVAGDGNLQLIADATSSRSNSYIDFLIDSTSTSKMRIDSSGYVGIGTSSPERALHTISSQQGIARFESTSPTAGFIDIKDANTTADNKVRVAAIADDLVLYSGGNITMTLDDSRNVGIGTTSPSAKLDVVGGSGLLGQFGNDNNPYYIQLGGVRSMFGYDGANAIIQGGTTKGIAFYTGGGTFADSTLEKMRINSNGNVGIGVSSPLELLDVGGGMRAFGYESRSGTNGITQYTGSFFNIFWTGSSAQLYIDTASVGTITLTSDYRVKKNIETQNASAIERINALRPVKYEYADYENIFVADNIQREGFIAHEVAQIIPSAVEGEKDAENAFQSLKLDAMLSVAVKAIQEQQEIINDLKARIETLEN